jgi:hypothetical protein
MHIKSLIPESGHPLRLQTTTNAHIMNIKDKQFLEAVIRIASNRWQLCAARRSHSWMQVRR